MTDWELPAGIEMPSIERVGGGGFLWDSGVYDATIKMVYLNQTESDAISFNIELLNSDGKTLEEPFWIVNSKAKGNKTWYTSKSGKPVPIPGYVSADHLCRAVLGETLDSVRKTAEIKTVSVYNKEQGKKVATEKPVITSLLNKAVKVAVQQVIVDKTAKNGNGQYLPTGETKNINECKFFGSVENGKTADEIAKNQPATMFTRWADKNTGIVINKNSAAKSKKATNTSAASIMDSTPVTDPTDSLFK
jgi:hypothetical protein